MSTPEYIKNLTIEERAAAIKLGCSIAFGRNGISEESYATKVAVSTADVLTAVPKSMIYAALLGGIPLGVIGHAMGRATSTDNRAEREAVDRLRYYQDLVTSMENKLPAPVASAPAADAQEDLDKEAKSPAWQRREGKNSKGGLNEKGRKSYERENPGSDLKAPVTGKVKPGGKASKRRKSYCSRSEGQMKMHNISCSKTPDKRICKARRKWKCAEDATDLEKQARVELIAKLLQALAKANQPTALGATKLQLQNVEAGPIGKTVAPAVSKLDAVLRKHRPEFPKGQAQQEAFGPLDQW